jgi:hypothetical protein
MSIRSSRPNGREIVVGLNNVSRAGEHENPLAGTDEEPGFEVPEEAIAAPLARQVNGCSPHVAVTPFELALESLEEGKCVGGSAGETDQNLATIDATHLAGTRFHDDFSDGDLTVGAHCDLSVPAHGENGGALNLADTHVAKAQALRLVARQPEYITGPSHSYAAGPRPTTQDSR